MNDTPLEIRRLQGQIVCKKPLQERLRMVFEMMEGGQRMVSERLRQKHPHWSKGELKAAVFERIYRNDFSLEEMERIKASFLAFYHHTA